MYIVAALSILVTSVSSSPAGAIRSTGSKLSLQRGAKFREGMGNGLRQNEDHNHESDRKHSQ
jgi:hypothetical protein